MENLSLIAAIGYQRELGFENKLIWKIKEDLDFYKNMTIGKNIIMGRKTLESMPSTALLKRNPIVLSSHPLDKYLDVECFNNIVSLINYIQNSSSEFVVVGGAKVYKELLPYVDTMYLTEILRTSRADTYFPYFYEEEWDIETIGDFLEEKVPYIRNKYTRKKVR